MSDRINRINQLSQRLEELLRKHESFSYEINGLRAEIAKLKNIESMLTDVADNAQQSIKEPVVQPIEPIIPIFENVVEPSEPLNYTTSAPIVEQAVESKFETQKQVSSNTTFEKYIGENLISKIGIAITVIGVGIGAKYSFDNDLISPLMRIVLGYLMGAALLGFGLKLKAKFLNYSSVLVSGAMAIMYFITFFAYAYYGLFSQTIAFLLMVIFTIFTVLAALNYNKQIIAHIGLVGAIAVPFLLSNGSGKFAIFYTYIAIVNAGILIIAIQKYWKVLYFNAFGLTWFIFLGWYIFKYQSTIHFNLAFGFSSLFFAYFYATFLIYKLVKNEQFILSDVVLVLLNSFIYFGIGFTMLEETKEKSEFLGLFTVINGLIHSAVGYVIYKRKKADQNLYYLVGGLSMVFITLAVPLQLDGNWVTLLWIGEAVVLFWIGRTKGVFFYEKLAIPMMILALISLFYDWDSSYFNYYYYHFKPIFNIHFLGSMLFICATAFINFIHFKKPLELEDKAKGFWSIITPYFVPGILIFSTYMAFVMEIANYWNQKIVAYTDSSNDLANMINVYWEYMFSKTKLVWIIIFSMCFTSILSIVNAKKIKNETFAYIILFLNMIALVEFLTDGLYQLSELRAKYIETSLDSNLSNFVLRYVAIAASVFLFWAAYQSLLLIREKRKNKIIFDTVLHISILWILSSELIHWLDINSSSDSHKLGLSILWGIYALFLIVYGIWKINQPLRIGAMLLFGITLVKLFFYDIAHLNTISKTIVFVSLGILLLIISFLYNKYKGKITDQE